jgi:hypothetical protein
MKNFSACVFKNTPVGDLGCYSTDDEEIAKKSSYVHLILLAFVVISAIVIFAKSTIKSKQFTFKLF